MADKHTILFIGRGQTYVDLKPRLQQLKDTELRHQEPAAVEEMKGGHTDVLIVEFAGSNENTLALLEEIVPRHADSFLLLLTPQKPDPDNLIRYMHHGIRDIITHDDNPEPILRNALALINRKSDSQSSGGVRLGRVCAFFGAKGGVGKTFLAVSTGKILGRTPTYKTLLLDLDLQFGDMDLYLNANSLHTLGELMEEVKNNDGRISDFILDNHLHQISPSLHLISAPLSPEKADIVTESAMVQLMKILKKRYDFIVIDAGGVLNEITLAAFDKSDRIFLVANDEIASIKTAAQTHRLLKQLNYPDTKLDFILNAASDRFPLDSDTLLKILTRKPYFRVPPSSNVRDSFNRGYILVDQKENDPAVRAVLQFTEKIAKDFNVRLNPKTEKTGAADLFVKAKALLAGKKA